MPKTRKDLDHETRRKSNNVTLENIERVKSSPATKRYSFDLIDVTEEAERTQNGDEIVFGFIEDSQVAALHKGKILGYVPKKPAFMIASATNKGRRVSGTVLSISNKEGKFHVRVEAIEH